MKSITLFSGCGGSALGLEQAGYKNLLSVEWDNNAVKTLAANFPNTPVYHGDICNLKATEILELTGTRVGEIDLLQASPPCQGFSVQGKMDFYDKRNYLYKHTLKIIEGLQPKTVVIENVKGMTMGLMASIYLDLINSLRELGYKACGEIMDAAHFDTPQHRDRVIVIAVRKDLGVLPSFPVPQTAPKTYRQAIYKYKSKHEEFLSLTPLTLKRWQVLKPGENAYKKYGWFRLGYHKFSWDTEIKTVISSVSCLIMHPDKPRRLYVGEAALLAGFPNSFIFTGSRSEQIKLIGNTLPPPMMKALTLHIKNCILTNHSVAN